MQKDSKSQELGFFSVFVFMQICGKIPDTLELVIKAI